MKRINEIFASGDFTLEKATQASSCLVGIYKWCEAMVLYHEILKTVNPLREQAKTKKIELEAIQKDLKEKRARLKAVQDKIDALEKTYQEKVDFEANLQAKIDEANLKLYRANKIIEGLSGEKTRWEETVARLTRDQGFLIGNCLIAAGLNAYGGAFTAQFRMRLEEHWRQEAGKRGLKLLEGICMKDMMEDPIQTKMWNAASLPSDNLSIENAIIMFSGGRWPIMIDPQNQANKFLKKFGFENAPKEMETMKASDPALMKMLELGIQFGRWFLVENIGESLDPALEPILQKQVDKSGNLKLGDKSIQYDTDFRFFMTTTLPNPHYAPETQVKVAILNFAITPFGLEEQMLNQFITLEMPELQKKKDAIVQQNAKAAKDLFDCEDKILEGLTKNESIADILKTDELIIVLDESKSVSDDIKVRMAESAITEKQIDETREAYRPVAFRASLLFFTIIDLAAINDMYQYSLQWFAGLFGASVNNSAKTKEGQVAQRIENLNNHFTLSLYENVCRSLFEKNKLMFSLVLCAQILFGDKKLDPDEWRFFLAGPTGQIDVVPNPTTWLGDLEWATMWKQIFMMSKLPSLKGFDEYFLANSHEFQTIFDSNTPQDEPFPGKWNDLDYFQKMIIIKAIRLDKIPFAIQNYVTEKIGEQYIIPPTFSVPKSYKDSSSTCPLIFVLSQGSDPVADFKRFAEEMNMTRKYEAISLGRGQDKKAINCINTEAGRGGWALLMNCHLASGFMPKLEVIVDTLDQTQPHRDFRLWLTSMPAKTFPVSVLQNSVKMTLEPPSGLRQNVRSSYEALNWQDIEDTEKPDINKKLLWGFCFFHAIVQDRRKFGPIGWNIRYAFTNEDLMVCRKQLLTFVDRFDAVPYKTLNYLGAEVNYGGRVTDYNDVLLIKTILKYYICEEALKVGHKFSASGKYVVIDGEDKDDYLNYIDTLPLNPEPEAFSLHENAEITTKQTMTIDLLLDVLAMQPKSSGGGGASREDIIGQLAADLEKRAPPPFDTEQVSMKFPTMYNESMNTVLFQECVRYNGLLSQMAPSLKTVQRALLGEVVMSEDLEKMADAIFDNRVPPVWVKTGFLSMKPLSSWIDDCNKRIDFLNEWIKNGTPKVFWISGFFFPQAFFTGSLQNYARSKFIAVDRIAFDFVFKDELTADMVTEKPESGAYCYGCYIEGCKWNYDTHMLDDSDPKKLFVDLPMLWYKAVEDRVAPKTGIYMMPVYKVLSRSGTLSTTGHSTNFVMKIEVPTDRDPEYWIKAGVATFLALRD